MTVSAIMPKNCFMNSNLEKQPIRLVIFINDIEKIQGCSTSTASRRLKELKESLAKQDHQEVTIKEYCNYFDFDYKEICQFLKLIS